MRDSNIINHDDILSIVNYANVDIDEIMKNIVPKKIILDCCFYDLGKDINNIEMADALLCKLVKFNTIDFLLIENHRSIGAKIREVMCKDKVNRVNVVTYPFTTVEINAFMNK